MRLSSFTIAITVIFIATSCKFANRNSFVDNWLEKEILFDYSNLVKDIGSGTNNAFDYFNQDFKIIIYIDGNCSNCISELNSWNQLIEKNKLKIPLSKYIFIIGTQNIYMTELLMKKLDNFKGNYWFDINDTFFNSNMLDSNNKHTYTFLLDSANRVKLIGSPLNNPTLTKLYLDFIDKNYNEEG